MFVSVVKDLNYHYIYLTDSSTHIFITRDARAARSYTGNTVWDNLYPSILKFGAMLKFLFCAP